MVPRDPGFEFAHPDRINPRRRHCEQPVEFGGPLRSRLEAGPESRARPLLLATSGLHSGRDFPLAPQSLFPESQTLYTPRRRRPSAVVDPDGVDHDVRRRQLCPRVERRAERDGPFTPRPDWVHATPLLTERQHARDGGPGFRIGRRGPGRV